MSHCPSTGGGRRSRQSEPRKHKITVRLSKAELAAVTAAADRAGLALAAYIIQAGLDRAEHRSAPIGEVQREALAELIRAAGLVRRIGVNLNQAVARLNATGAAGPDLGPIADYCMRVLGRIDEAAMTIQRQLKPRPDRERPGGSAGFRRRTPLARRRPPSLARPPRALGP